MLPKHYFELSHDFEIILQLLFFHYMLGHVLFYNY
jgi:hypothetical protein